MIRLIYITGDTHRDFARIYKFCEKQETTKNDILIILGDAGINFYNDKKDRAFKQALSNDLSINLFCIHGNHEKRPTTISTYKEMEYRGGIAYIEPEFPNLIFAKDGEVYDFNGVKTLVIGGAYSIDKFYRIRNHLTWFPDEQPDDTIKQRVENKLKELDYKVDAILSHTVPIKYEPTEVFLKGVDQSKVDKSTERWLDEIEEKTDYTKWFAGHYHTEKSIDKLRIMFNDIREFTI